MERNIPEMDKDKKMEEEGVQIDRAMTKRMEKDERKVQKRKKINGRKANK